MPANVFKLAMEKEYPQRIVASFLGMLAYPDAPTKRKRYEATVGVLELRRRVRTDPDWAHSPQTVVPALLTANPAKARRIINECHDVICNRRRVAALMGMDLLAAEGLSNLDPRQVGKALGRHFDPPLTQISFDFNVRLEDWNPLTEAPSYQKKKLNVTSLTKFYAQELNKAGKKTRGKAAKAWTPENVMHRIWGQSKPVLHAAMAMKWVTESLLGDEAGNDRVWFEKNWVEQAVQLSEVFRRAIVESKAIPIKEDQTIQFVIPPPSKD